MEQTKKTSIPNLEPNVSAALSYIVPPFTGIVFYIIEKENKFVKFHAFQSILLGIFAIIAIKIAEISRIFLVGIVIEPIVSLILFILGMYCIWKAYNNVEYEIPYLGKIAKTQTQK